MSLFEEPEETSSGSGKWVLLVVIVCLAAGGAYLFGPRWVGTDEVTDTSAGPGPVSVSPANRSSPVTARSSWAHIRTVM